MLDDWLRHAMASTRQKAWLCSAYIKAAAFERLLELRPKDEPLQAAVLVRWQPSDLLSGASDLDLFTVCCNRNLELFLKLDFHGKVYALPPLGISVGSTNTTASGLGFGSQPNSEMNTLVACTKENLDIVRNQFNGATRVTDALFERMRLEVEAMKRSNTPRPNWSSDVMSHLEPPEPPASLLVDECFLTDGSWWSQRHGIDGYVAAEHDLQLLGESSSSLSEVALQAVLRRTKCIRWLTAQLISAPKCELYFGALTAALHNALLDDPGPRRLEVKSLLKNLLSWIQLADLPEVLIDQPNYSQRVRFITSPP
jgi:hypothetical protein